MTKVLLEQWKRTGIGDPAAEDLLRFSATYFEIYYIRGVRELVLLLIILTNNKSKKERKIERTVLFPTPTDNTA